MFCVLILLYVALAFTCLLRHLPVLFIFFITDSFPVFILLFCTMNTNFHCHPAFWGSVAILLYFIHLVLIPFNLLCFVPVVGLFCVFLGVYSAWCLFVLSGACFVPCGASFEK